MTRVICLLLFVFNPSDTTIKYYRALTYNHKEVFRIMENVIETNGEPVTIKITIEVIPGKKKEDKKVETPIVPLIPDGWKEVEPTPVVDPLPIVEPTPTVDPIPEKKGARAYTKKVKSTEEKPVETPVEEKPADPIVDEKKPEPTKSVVKPTTNPNKVVARIAQMIRFYCKASGIETSTITIAQLKEKAFDIVENVTDDVINEAIKEAIGK